MAFFGGNPNVTIPAINTVGGIVSSRTSGETPAFVMVSASAITATGTLIPYEDLEFSWDFGDPNGVEIFQNPVGNQSAYGYRDLNANDKQIGPEAAYCYRAPGDYTVTLKIRGANGSAFTTATVTTAIKVSAFDASNGTFYFDATNGNDAGAGTEGDPYQTIAKLLTLLGTKKQFFLKRGENFTDDYFNLQAVGDGPMRFGAYGTGARPRITNTDGSCLLIRNQNEQAHEDFVWSNILFDGQSTSDTTMEITGASGAQPLEDIYFDNCHIRKSVSAASTSRLEQGFQFAPVFDNMGFWQCDFDGYVDAATSNNAHTLFGGAQNWFFMVGGFRRGAGSNTLIHHHIYSKVNNHGLFRWLDFGKGPGRNFCFNMDCPDTSQDGDASVDYSDFFLIVGCNMTGTERNWDCSENQLNSAIARFRNFIVQDCATSKMGADGGNAMGFFKQGETITVRDCLYWGSDAAWSGMQAIGAGEGQPYMTLSVYRCKFYGVGVAAGTGVILRCNDTSYTGTITITDNEFTDERTAAKFIRLPFGTTAIIDRNQYYAPNDGAPEWEDGVTPKTWAEWQANGWDVNGIIADPGWVNPASGVFEQKTGSAAFA